MNGPDPSRQDATSPDTEYSLTIAEAADRYAAAGHARTPRAIQRYCANGHLDCRKVATAWGDKYLVAPYSVARHVSQITEMLAATGRDASLPVAAVLTDRREDEFGQASLVPFGADQHPDAAGGDRTDEPADASTSPTTSRDQSRPDVAPVAEELSQTGPRQDPSTGRDASRQVAADTAYMQRLEKENDFLHEQIAVKDTQIRDLTERARETNHLIGGLQRMLSPLLGSGDRRDRSNGDARPYPERESGYHRNDDNRSDLDVFGG